MIIPIHKPTLSEFLDLAFTQAKLEQRKGTPYPHGICGVMTLLGDELCRSNTSGDDCCYIQSKFSEWPKSSGNSVYPIPSPITDGRMEAQIAYGKYRFKGWDTNYEYARLRYEMIEWTISKLKEEECSMQV